MRVDPYLVFDGRAEEAAAFYRQALGAEVTTMLRFKDAPKSAGPSMNPPGTEEKIMHMSLKIGDATILGSDGYCSGKPDFKGMSLTLSAADDAEAKRLFSALSEGGQIQVPLASTFFASSFGILSDRFGVGWMVYCGP